MRGARLHNWLLFGGFLWGLLSVYYYRIAGSMETPSFLQAFALFAFFTTGAALTSVWMRGRRGAPEPRRLERFVDRTPVRGKRVPVRPKNGIVVPASQLHRHG